MKVTKLIFLALITSLLSITSHADQGNTQAVVIPADAHSANDNRLPKINLHQLQKKGDNGIETAAPADPLWYVEIAYVYSSNQGWESIPASAFSTSLNHGGSQMVATVLELGYGGSRFVQMAGSTLSSSANYYNDDICWDFSGNLTYNCTSGMTLAGYERYYNISGHQSGTFSFQSTSIVSPWNTEYDSLYIQ